MFDENNEAFWYPMRMGLAAKVREFAAAIEAGETERLETIWGDVQQISELIDEQAR